MGGSRGGDACFAEELIPKCFPDEARILDRVVKDDSSQPMKPLSFLELIEFYRERGLGALLKWAETSPASFDSNADVLEAFFVGVEGASHVLLGLFSQHVLSFFGKLESVAVD